MGDLHNEVFSVIKQNGYTYDDIGATPSLRGRKKEGRDGAVL